MGKVYCILGKSGSGKSTIEKELQRWGLMRITSTTTRPIREGERDGIDYYYISKDEFIEKMLKGDFLENTVYNNWLYGIDKTQLDLENKNYVAVVNPRGYSQLKDILGIDKIVPIYIYVNDKERVLRALHREENPNVYEICRRMVSDVELFKEVENDDGVFKIENRSLYKTVCEVCNYINRIEENEDF